MDWLEIGLIFSVVYALHLYQQIKMTLKEAGHPIEFFTGWIGDYRRFKQLIENEADDQTKIKHQKILKGLHFALGGTASIVVLIVYRHFFS